MIEDTKDLGITGKEEDEQLDAILQEKLGISLSTILGLLRESLYDRATQVAAEFLVMTPNGDYDKLIEEQPKMAHFLRNEASKDENWEIVYIGSSRDGKMPNMVELMFHNKVVDDGDAVVGYVYLSYSGKVLHVFVQGEP